MNYLCFLEITGIYKHENVDKEFMEKFKKFLPYWETFVHKN